MRTVSLFLVCALGLLAFITLGESKDPSKSWQFNALKAKRDPHSKQYMKNFPKYVPASLKKVLVMCQWGVAMAEATDPNQCHTVKLRDPSSGRLDSKICMPPGTKADNSPDAALTIYDKFHNREHDLWKVQYDGNGQVISALNGMSFTAGADSEIDSDGAMGGANLGCVPLRRGTVTPEDLRNGITQTMQMALPEIGKGAPRWPAIHSLPRTNHGNVAKNVGKYRMVAGTWVRLPKNVKIPGDLHPWEKVIAQGLINHGAIIRDFSHKLIIYGKDTINNQPGELKFTSPQMADLGIKAWGGYCPNGDAKDAVFSPSFPWSKLEVILPPPHKPVKLKPRSKTDIKSGKCWKICMPSCQKSVKGSKKTKAKKCTTKCLAKCKTKGH